MPSRRGLITAAAAVGLVAADGPRRPHRGIADAPEPPVPMHGVHQAGVTTPAQQALSLAAFDLVTGDPGAAAETLRSWTRIAEVLTLGRRLGDFGSNPAAVPGDTADMLQTGHERLTITVGCGPALAGRAGARAPDALAALPSFPGDRLETRWSGGDLLVQACADSPVVTHHVLRALGRAARGVFVPRWVQRGFLAPRNLFGYEEGQGNLATDDALASSVWVADEGPAWLRGGTYLVVRRIRMHLEAWDRLPLGDQEASVGRHKLTGNPLTRPRPAPRRPEPVRDDEVNLLPDAAHVRLAHPSAHGGVRLLRRGYSYDDGVDAAGRLDAGTLFVCFQRDPVRQFVPIMRRLAEHDRLHHYLTHTGSAVFAVLPGIEPGDWLGSTLFGQAVR